MSDARNEVVLDEAPEKRDRELDDDDGVFRPEDEPSVVALLISSCMTDEVVDEPAAEAVVDPLDMAAAAAAAELPAASS